MPSRSPKKKVNDRKSSNLKDLGDTTINNSENNGARTQKQSGVQNGTELSLTDSENQLFWSQQNNGEVKVLWYLKNIDQYWGVHDTSKKGLVKSDIFKSPDKAIWKLILKPNGESDAPDCMAIFLKAIRKREIGEKETMNRVCKFRVSYYKDNRLAGTWKGSETFTNEDSEWGFKKFINIEDAKQAGMDKQLFIEWYIESDIYIEQFKKDLHITAGIKNEGTTWYVNSCLQTLFIIAPLRKAVFKMPTDGESQIPLCLQRVFYNLEFSNTWVSTAELLNSFGWQNEEINQQHDVSEFLTELASTLEQMMDKEPELKHTFKNLFEVEITNWVDWINVDFKSRRKESFFLINLEVSDLTTIEDSIKKFTQTEILDEDNKYDAGIHGKQVAEKSMKISRLPPVLWFLLKRFNFNRRKGNPTKVNAEIKIPETLDLEACLEFDDDADRSIPYKYKLHSMLMHTGTPAAGHYFAYIKNSANKDHWLEFNDTEVKLRDSNYCISNASGGDSLDFRVQDNIPYEKRKCNATNAYMLYYIREQELESILECPSKDEVPKELDLKFSCEQSQADIIFDRAEIFNNSDVIWAVWEDIIQGWGSFGIFPCTKKVQNEEALFKNINYRKKLSISKKLTVFEFIQLLKEKLYPYKVKQVLMYKIGKQRF